MNNSILESVKKVLGLEPDYTAFDVDLVMHINTTFSTLQQLGIGPANGFSIDDTVAVWEDFIGTNALFNQVKTYVYLRVRMLFDPPPTSYSIQAVQTQITELEWRLTVTRDEVLSWAMSSVISISE